MMEMYPDRATRDEILDVMMRNLPQGVRDAMALFQMSETEYRQRTEQMLFGPVLMVSTGGANSSRAEIIPSTAWPFGITSGSVTCPATLPGGWQVVSIN